MVCQCNCCRQKICCKSGADCYNDDCINCKCSKCCCSTCGKTGGDGQKMCCAK
uniref:Uncharacterized protein n=1 Tax=Meloidogyne enterolobii TaxID=390850 RepID=A0A6V7WR24_MELEN|nr:unnamed protein product [Meloidogyne enterolobii]